MTNVAETNQAAGVTAANDTQEDSSRGEYYVFSNAYDEEILSEIYSALKDPSTTAESLVDSLMPYADKKNDEGEVYGDRK